MLMDTRYISSILSKAQLMEFLGIPKKTKVAKELLIVQVLSCIETNPLEHARLLDSFVFELAVGPTELEELLECSTVERKRWVKEGKIPILEYRTFRKAGQDLKYPVHDRRMILHIDQDDIQRWREEYSVQVQEHKKIGVQVAVERRKVNQHLRQQFQVSWCEMVFLWIQQGSLELAAVLQLAFWTAWASRWAKENHLKSLRGTKHALLYATRREEWYRRKNEALHILSQTPYTWLSFYRPENPDKITIRLCDEHYEEKIEGFYEDKWDFYAVHRATIKSCPHCFVNVEKDYYALYYLQITTAIFPEIHFSFHTPYPLGKKLFPAPKTLPLVVHMEQDGIFRFGRILFPYEKITHREKDVQKYFEQALKEVQRFYHTDIVRECIEEMYVV